MLNSFFKLEKTKTPVGEEITWDEGFGKPEDFGPYISGSPLEFIELENGDVLLQSIDSHNRAANVPFMFLNRPDLHELDLKSTGTRFNTSFDENTRSYQRKAYPIYHLKGNREVMGILNYSWGVHDHKTQKTFKSLGIRTHESIGVIPLTEIYYEGKKYEIKKDGNFRYFIIENDEKFIFPENYIPAQQIRAWGTAHRIQDIESLDDYKSKGQETNRDVILQAINMVKMDLLRSGELKEGESFGVNEYLLWFTKTLAKNIALMHKAGYTHRFLHTGNITLDCRLTDFDSVTNLKNRKIELGSFLDSDSHYKGVGLQKGLALDLLADLDGNTFGMPPDYDKYPRSKSSGFSSIVSLFKTLNDKSQFPEFNSVNVSPNVLKDIFYSEYNMHVGGLFDFSQKDKQFTRLPVINESKFNVFLDSHTR